MALSKLFERIFWHNNTTPAINEDNLNSMSKAIDDIDDRVIALGDDVLTIVPQIQTYLAQAQSLVEAMELLSENPPYIGSNGNWFVWDTETSAFVDSGVDASITVSIADITMEPYGTAPYVTNTGTNTDPVFHLHLPAPSGIKNIAKTSTSGLVDTYTITFDDNSTKTFTVTNGKGITGVAKTGTSGLVDTYTISFNDGTSTTFNVTNGADGDDGRGIVSITKTGTSGLVDTYTITYTDNTTSTFTVTNGQDGSGSGDMSKSDYDSDSSVKNAGGIKAFIQGLGYITGLAWSALTGKPFETVGAGLSVDNQNVLKADVQSVSVGTTGTASSSAVSYQRIGVNGSYTEIKGTKYMEQTIQTSTSADVPVTFLSAEITADSEIFPFTSKWGLVPSDVVTTSGQCVVTIPKQTTAFTLTVRIHIS